MHARLRANLGRTVGPAAPIPMGKMQALTQPFWLFLNTIYLPSSSQRALTSQIATWRDQNFFVLLPTQITFGYKCCREHRLMLRDHHLHQYQDIQQPWELLGSQSLGTPSTSAMAGKQSLGLRSENQAQRLLRQGNWYLLQAFPLCPGQNPSSARPRGSGILPFQCFGHCLSTATLLSRDFCGK